MLIKKKIVNRYAGRVLPLAGSLKDMQHEISYLDLSSALNGASLGISGENGECVCDDTPDSRDDKLFVVRRHIPEHSPRPLVNLDDANLDLIRLSGGDSDGDG